ncbi:hypothetical protein ACFXGI_17895 [Streptomyces sp. NPDC059355]|uniref:hypothetical protein n=1 Tax=Streptomyces sp. NPDC059355 TaxID=3346811 RepID=UPI003675D4B0
MEPDADQQPPKPKPAVEAQREALAVWRPFEDDLLAHRLRADAEAHGARWRAEGAALLERYRALAAVHTRCTRHHDPKSNAAILRRALEDAVAGRAPDPRSAGLLRHAVASMAAKRGLPGSAEHTRLRAVQAAQAARPRLHEHRAPRPGALQASVSDLLAQGAIPSAEVLAELIPRPSTARTAAQARAELRAIGELAVEAFPGAGIPNRLAGKLSRLAEAAELPVPILTEPFASGRTYAVNADLFPAAWTAADLLKGTPYERYHGIDFAAVRDLAESRDPAEFAGLCARRAGLAPQRCTGPDGPQAVALAREATVDEQARVLTTFNMATLVRVVGMDPPSGWDGLARGAFTAARRRSATPGSGARAWRQLVFHLSLCDPGRQAAVLAWIEAEFTRLPRPVAARLSPAFARLRSAVDPPTSSGTRPFRRAFRP